MWDAFRPEFLAEFDIKAPIRIPRAFAADPPKPYHIPYIEMPEDLHHKLSYEGKIDRSARNIDWLIEQGEAAAKRFLKERAAAVANPPINAKGAFGGDAVGAAVGAVMDSSPSWRASIEAALANVKDTTNA